MASSQDTIVSHIIHDQILNASNISEMHSFTPIVSSSTIPSSGVSIWLLCN